MSTFLEISGALFWLSLGAGGLWVGLCGLCSSRARVANDWWLGVKRQMDNEIAEYLELEHGIPRKRTLQRLAVENRRAQEAEARDV